MKLGVEIFKNLQSVPHTIWCQRVTKLVRGRAFYPRHAMPVGTVAREGLGKLLPVGTC